MSDISPRNPSQSSAASESAKPQDAFSELLAQWVELYAGNYGKEPTDETYLAYRIGLSDLKVKFLHDAFAECLRKCSFWPTVAEIRNAYYIAADRGAGQSPMLPEARPELTEKERAEINAEMTRTAEKLGLGHVVHRMTESELSARKEFLRKQAANFQGKTA